MAAFWPTAVLSARPTAVAAITTAISRQAVAAAQHDHHHQGPDDRDPEPAPAIGQADPATITPIAVTAIAALRLLQSANSSPSARTIVVPRKIAE